MESGLHSILYRKSESAVTSAGRGSPSIRSDRLQKMFFNIGYFILPGQYFSVDSGFHEVSQDNFKVRTGDQSQGLQVFPADRHANRFQLGKIKRNGLSGGFLIGLGHQEKKDFAGQRAKRACKFRSGQIADFVQGLQDLFPFVSAKVRISKTFLGNPKRWRSSIN